MYKRYFSGLLLLALLISPSLTKAQFQTNGSDLYHLNGDVGVGLINPNRELHVYEELTGYLPYPSTIEQATTGIRIEHRWRFTNNSTWTNYRWDMQASRRGFSIFDSRLSEYRMFIDNDGNVGVGNTTPTHRLEVEGTGKFTGKVGIGGDATGYDLEVHGTAKVRDFHWIGNTANTLWARSTVVNDVPFGPEVAIHALGNNTGANSQNTIYVTTYGAGQQNQGIYSTAFGTCIGQGEGSFAVGVHGQAASADNNYGVMGRAGIGSTCKIGLTAGIYGYTPTSGTNKYAGYFQGDLFASSGPWTGSDRKLKRDIKGMDDISSKLMALKPRTYEFRTDEFDGMALPEGQQYGFIAQDLEKIFPEMTRKTISPAIVDENGKVEHASVDFTAVQYQSLIPVLVQGFQEQQLRLEDQASQIEAQAREIEALQAVLGGSGVGKTSPGNDDLIGGEARLGTNVPNPFQEYTMIPVFIPAQAQSAKIILFDMTGRQIKEMSIAEKGETEIQLNAQELAAGMYIYALLVDGKEIDSMRMILNH